MKKCTFLGITPASSVSNGLYFLTLPIVSVMRVIYQKIRHARYLYIKRNVEKVWGARYTLGARYLSKNTPCTLSIHQKECRKSLGCALYIRCALSIEKYGNLKRVTLSQPFTIPSAKHAY